MDELKAVAEVINAGGNAALLLCAFYIYKSTLVYARVADRLARIEAKLDIDQSTEKE